jgi:hypothetical protein
MRLASGWAGYEQNGTKSQDWSSQWMRGKKKKKEEEDKKFI